MEQQLLDIGGQTHPCRDHKRGDDRVRFVNPPAAITERTIVPEAAALAFYEGGITHLR